MMIDQIEDLLKQKLVYAPSLGTVLKFELGETGVLVLDGTQTPPVIEREEKDAETTITCSADVLGQLLNGALDPTMAFMTGKLKVKGSMGYAMKLVSILED